MAGAETDFLYSALVGKVTRQKKNADSFESAFSLANDRRSMAIKNMMAHHSREISLCIFIN